MTQSSLPRIFLFALLLFGLTALAGTGALAAQPDPQDRLSVPVTPGDMNDISIPPLVGGVPAGPKPPSGVAAASLNPGVTFQSAVDAPAITLWYTSNQTFGQNGDPQKWINIVGNVSSTVKLANLSYTLNGSASRTVSIGPNDSRLNKKGDFNIDIDYTDLNNGANTVVITATDENAGVTTANVTVNYQPFAGSWSPQTYTIDFASAATVNQVAQVVDGNWVIDGGKARPAAGETGYDRLVALGDISWRDYTVTVPVTIHSIRIDKSPGVGLIVRWPGHYDAGNGLQPYAGWRRIGAMAWYRYDKATSTEGLQLLGSGGNTIGTSGFTLVPGTTYMFKVNVTSNANPNKPATYRFKTWVQGQTEPAAWDIEASGLAGEQRNGSILLVAHYADASFGNVTVDLSSTQPKPVLNISKTGTGTGTVTPNPQKTSYRFGEDVTLTAVAGGGSTFAGWQGDASGSSPTTSIEMFADRNVTAVFADPAVQTPISDDFSGCNLNTGLWTFVNPLSDATLVMNGSQAEIQIPSGTAHDFWTNGYNAPRIMQYAENGDFELEVSFDSVMNSKNQLQGILIAGEADKYIRFNFLHDGNGYKIQAYTFSGADTPVSRANQGITISAPMKLRIQRIGNYWLTKYYPNPSNAWGSVVNFEFEMVMNSFGVFAGTSGNNPAFTSKVDYFFNTASPISPEDSSRRLNITTTGSGSVTPDPVKENYACDEVVTLTAVPSAGYKFNAWGGDMSGTENPKTLVMNTTKNVVANFVPDVQYTVTVTPDPAGGGGVTKFPEKPTYSPGEQVTLTATPSLGYVFTSWSGGASGTTNPLTVTVNNNLNITANFTSVPDHTLTVLIDGNGSVTKTPEKTTYLHGEQVTLTAVPGVNSNFAGWSGSATGTENPLMIVMDADKTITASFKSDIHTLTLLANPTGTGTITPNPVKSAYYDGETVLLTPVPAAGYQFAGWSGDLLGSNVPGQLVMTKNSTVTANFVPQGTFTVGISLVGPGSVMMDPPGGSYSYGTQVTLTGLPGLDQEFIGWSGDLISSDNPAVITVTKNMAITATFGPAGIYSLTLLPAVNGSITVDPVRDLYAPGQQVTLTAVPDPGYIFSSWGNDGNGSTTNPLVLTMDGNKTVSVVFEEPPLYSLTVTPNGPGTVTNDPPGNEFIAGTTVTLTATPSAGYAFAGWSGDIVSNTNPYPLLMDGPKNIFANFVLTSGLASDDFDGCGVLSSIWTWSDPLGQATYGLTGTQFKIVLPPNEDYEAWREGNNSARIMQEVANTNFEVIAGFDTMPTQAGQTQGIMFEGGEGEFIRVDFYHDGVNLNFFGGAIVNGVVKHKFSGIIDLTGITAPRLALRVLRDGDMFRSSYRLTDDGEWLRVKGSNFKHVITLQSAGVFAAAPLSGQTSPGHTALIDYFFNADSPIVPEDANAPGIVITPVGQGSFTLTPSTSPYACGQKVEVKAVPALGWRFQNFSGDLNGSTNPQTVTVSKKHNVTITFVKLDVVYLFMPVVISNK